MFKSFKKLVVTVFVLAFVPLTSATTSSVFAKFPNQYFIETGTYVGDGVQKAIDAGFQNIYSIELSTHFYKIASERFKDYPNVHIFQGDSSEILEAVLQEIDGPATLWLDGHYSGGQTARGFENCPILKELAIIKNHHIKQHTILIDDIRCCGTQIFNGITLKEVVDCAFQINPRYKISFEDGHIPKDVLVFTP